MSKDKKKKKKELISDLMVFRLFMFNELYRFKMLPIIKFEYFDDLNMQDIFKRVIKYYEKKNEFPKSIKGLIYRNPWNDGKEILQEKLSIADVDKKEMQLIPVEDHLPSIQEWLQAKTFIHVLKSGFNSLEDAGSVDFLEYSEKVKKITRLNFDNEIGVSIRSNDNILDIYQNTSPKIKMNNEHWDYVTAGGCQVGTLNIIMGPSHSGKSRHMMNMALDYIKNPDINVLYISLEMSDKQMMERFDAMLLGLSTQELRKLTIDSDEESYNLYRQYKDVKLKTLGNIIIKRFAASTASIIDFAHLIYNLRANGFKPHVVFVDYLGISASSNNQMASSHEKGQMVSEQYRDFFEREQVVGWSSVQTYQGTQKDSTSMNMFDVAGSKAIAATSDLFAIIMQDKYMKQSNQQVVKIDKNREEGIIGCGIICKLHDRSYKLSTIGIRDKMDQDTEAMQGEKRSGVVKSNEATKLRNGYRNIHNRSKTS